MWEPHMIFEEDSKSSLAAALDNGDDAVVNVWLEGLVQ
jgi:hypothetical protein